MANQSGQAKEYTRGSHSRQDVTEVKQKSLVFLLSNVATMIFLYEVVALNVRSYQLRWNPDTMSFFSDFDSTPMAVYILAVLISMTFSVFSS